ncbi:MAG: sigma-54-dependent transcriptional regulator [Planctomycetota bacterium]|jgi:two-component system response regulator AtoC/two-component system nitrogen regulation response regulator NtrX
MRKRVGMGLPSILIVDDEKGARFGMKMALENEGYVVYEAASGPEALDAIDAEFPGLVFLDINMPDMNGLEVLGRVREAEDPPLVVIVTAHGSEKVAVEAMKKGAYDYVAKPFEIDELRLIAKNAMENLALRDENKRLRSQLENLDSMGEILGKTEAIKDVFARIGKVAATDVTVLILGESGSGKELVAREVHKRSKRSRGPLVVMNCAAVPDTLIESELFGHEKGAFTGATSRRVGKFEQADGGTLFLDEVGDMSISTQAKFLRAVEEQAFERLGGVETLRVDVRVLSATNKDLQNEIKEGTFREDLYYRLKVVEIMLPPLRQRRGDIPLLVHHFLGLYSKRHNKDVKGVSKEVMQLVMSYDWPGNVRQLANMLESAVVLAGDSVLTLGDIPGEVSGSTEGLPVRSASKLDIDFDLPFKEAKKRAVEAFEREFINRSLDEHDGNVTRTASALGMHRQALQQKVRELRLRERTGE